MALELLIVLVLNTIALASFGFAYWKFGSMSDVLMIVDNIEYGKAVSLIFLMSLVYLLLIIARYLIFSKTTEEEEFQVIKDNSLLLLRSINMIEDYSEFFKLMSANGVKALILVEFFVHVQIICCILEKRIDELHQRIVEREIAEENEENMEENGVVIEFINLLCPLAFVVATFYFLRKYYNLGFATAMGTLEPDELYLRGAFFAYLEISVYFAQETLAFIINLIICALPPHLTPHMMCIYQAGGLLLDFFSMGIYATVFSNSLAEVLYGVDITRISEIRDLIKQRKRPLSHISLRTRFVHMLLVDLTNFISAANRIKRHYDIFKLNYRAVTRLSNFPVPTFEELYNCNEKDVRADPDPHIQNAICPICMDVMDLTVDPEKIRIIGCRHSYHTACIRNWLARGNPKCPVCNADVFSEEQHAEEDLVNDLFEGEIPQIEGPANVVEESESTSVTEVVNLDVDVTLNNSQIENLSKAAEESDSPSEKIREDDMNDDESGKIEDFGIEESKSSSEDHENLPQHLEIGEDILEPDTSGDDLEISQSPAASNVILPITSNSPEEVEDIIIETVSKEKEQEVVEPDKSTFRYEMLDLKPLLPERKEIMQIPVFVPFEEEDYSLEEICDAVECSCHEFINELRRKEYLHDNPEVWLRLEAIVNMGKPSEDKMIKHSTQE